jgi:hypothetical protein
MGHLDRAEPSPMMLNARFGDVDRETATKFWHGLPQGELGRGGGAGRRMPLHLPGEQCIRPDHAVLEAALTWTANPQRGRGGLMLTLIEICAVLGCSNACRPRCSEWEKTTENGDLVKRYQALMEAMDKGRETPLDQICIECPRQNCEGCRVRTQG